MYMRTFAAIAATATLAASGASAVDAYMFGFTPSGSQQLNVLMASGASVTLSAVGTGWYDFTGSHSSTNPNYIAGNCAVTGCNGTDGEYRDYFVFDLSSLSGGIVSASLSIGNPSDGFGGVPSTYTNWDVSTPISDLEASQSGATGIYADLGSGVMFASTGVSSADNGTQVSITLDAAALASLEAAEGGQWAVGGALNGVPEPATWAMMLLGFGLIGAAARSRRSVAA